MSSLSNLLRRFRYGGIPGAAVASAVPVDHRAELEAELGPVLIKFAEVDSDATNLLAEADSRAAEELATAQSRAQELVLQARRNAPRLRAQATVDVVARAEQQAQAIADGARGDAERIDALSAEHIRPLAASIVLDLLQHDFAWIDSPPISPMSGNVISSPDNVLPPT
jgi:vacuolar-type H+-ATPase subunit H